MKIKQIVVNVNEVADVIKSEPNEKNSLKNKLIEYRRMKNYLQKEGLIRLLMYDTRSGGTQYVVAGVGVAGTWSTRSQISILKY